MNFTEFRDNVIAFSEANGLEITNVYEIPDVMFIAKLCNTSEFVRVVYDLSAFTLDVQTYKRHTIEDLQELYTQSKNQ